jgi:5'-methylthioadenosine phosphorylase
MAEKRIGVIGGSGLYKIEGMETKKRVKVNTPFGDPSDELDIGMLEDHEIVFLPRHARGHRLLPSEINYRANIWAMKKLGVEWIISVSAVGSFKKEIKPLDIVLVDQFFDRSHGRSSTFFGDGVAGHIMFAHPVCPDLSGLLYQVAQKECRGIRVHPKGTYLNMEGPAFSTKAESLIYKSWGVDVIGMTQMTEARLAREAEICFATMAMVTDYDCWIEGDPDAIVSVEMIIENLNKNVAMARRIIAKAIPQIPDERHCVCASALKNAVITRPDRISKEAKERLDLILYKYLS